MFLQIIRLRGQYVNAADDRVLFVQDVEHCIDRGVSFVHKLEFHNTSCGGGSSPVELTVPASAHAPRSCSTKTCSPGRSRAFPACMKTAPRFTKNSASSRVPPRVRLPPAPGRRRHRAGPGRPHHRRYFCGGWGTPAAGANVFKSRLMRRLLSRRGFIITERVLAEQEKGPLPRAAPEYTLRRQNSFGSCPGQVHKRSPSNYSPNAWPAICSPEWRRRRAVAEKPVTKRYMF